MDSYAALRLVGARTAGGLLDKLGVHCELLVQSLDSLWGVSQVSEHGLEIYPVSAMSSFARSLVHGIVDSHCQCRSILDFETKS